MKQSVNVFWFRRDLRIEDNAGLFHALKGNLPVIPVFIFDKNILDKLSNKKDARVTFIHDTISELSKRLLKYNSALKVYYDHPLEVFKLLLNEFDIHCVFTNTDYEPYAKQRDKEVEQLLKENGALFCSFKDQVIFEKEEVVKDDGNAYTVFTPYSKKWKARLQMEHIAPFESALLLSNFWNSTPGEIVSLQHMGFNRSEMDFPSKIPDESIIEKYSDTRDFPAAESGTSRMGIHLRFGTISIRKLARIAWKKNQTYLNELIWRDFYQMILWHFPRVGQGLSFKPMYDHIQWRNNESEFERWCSGRTGYPIVDAGMRQLNQTGYMHNRVRMIVASFLTKHLLIDWRWGEAYFAEKLLDFDLAANNGGWQWASGSGCDAAPYFRIFNPYLQTQKFDEHLEYIKKWVPELNEFSYPAPIVEHEVARKRALEVYGRALRT